jgi:hypothetical protein
MSRKKKEQERIARRDAKRADSMTDLQREKASRQHHGGRDTAVHEAGHAVATWLLGEPLGNVYFNDRGAPWYEPTLDQFDAVTEGGSSAGEFGPRRRFRGREYDTSILQGTGEGWVRGCRQAFITLAGIVAQTEYLNNSEVPLTIQSHLSEAATKFWFFAGGNSDMTPGIECARIIQVVADTFRDERVKRAVMTVAGLLFKYRYLDAEQLREAIEGGYYNREITLRLPTWEDKAS